MKKLDEPESKYGTGGEGLSVFHKIAENDLGLSLRFPGYIVGIEKSDKKNIGIPDWNDHLNESEFNSSKNFERIKSILDDPKRTFISHTKRYFIQEASKNIPYIKEDVASIPSVYDKNFHVTPSYPTVYEKSYESLILLKQQIVSDVRLAKGQKQPYTHIFLYSMGWNTDQQESFRNFNSLMAQIIENSKTDFKPLFIGISWPSEWSWNFLESLGKVLSYPVKADDADEVGFLWGHRILRDILVPLKYDNGIPLVVIGHSFGARLLSRAVFSQPLSQKPKPSDIDLFVGLQGAFSVNRFITGEGAEGYPYENYKKYARKFIFTWSVHDSANPIAAHVTGAGHIGGSAGYEGSKKYPSTFDQFNILTNGIDNNYNIVFDHIDNPAKWDASFKLSDKISIINASNLIMHHPYGKGGNAHSDIYSPGVAKFIWSAIDNL